MNEMITKISGLVFIAIAIEFILCYPMMLLWNLCLVPATDLKEVEFWQMLGILFFVGMIVNPPKVTLNDK